jgi:hypothetical protein
MSFQELWTTIESDQLRAVAAHWQEARGIKDAPTFSDLRPSVMAKQLPIIWCYRYDDALGEFVGRLAGNSIARAFDRPFKNAPMSHLQKNHGHVRFADRAKRVVSERIAFRGTGLMFKQNDRYAVGERIIFPILNDAGQADSILGATMHHFDGFWSPGTVPQDEAEQWFSLDPQQQVA